MSTSIQAKLNNLTNQEKCKLLDYRMDMSNRYKNQCLKNEVNVVFHIIDVIEKAKRALFLAGT